MKSHLILRNPISGPDNLIPQRRGGSTGEAPSETIDPRKLDVYRLALANYEMEYARRQNERNPALSIPATITNIIIKFHGVFDAVEFEAYYLENFGLSLIKSSDFNKSVIFSVENEALFRNFLQEFNKIITCADHSQPDYDKRIKYIDTFELLSTEKIIHQPKDELATYYLSFLEVQAIFGTKIRPVGRVFRQYLEERDIVFRRLTKTNIIEVERITYDQVLEIARNFDIIYSINSAYRIIRPGSFGQEVRSYPFTINPLDERSNIIGIIDTGVSDQTPLQSILIPADPRFHISGGNPNIDDADHGTAVAALAALGDKLVGDITGSLEADCRILSIKILPEESGYLSASTVVNLIKKANEVLGVKIFVLTVCSKEPHPTNCTYSEYSYLLDKLSFENDILLFISIGNFDIGSNDWHIEEQYPQHFLEESTNLCCPSESMNNVTVGAIGSNFEDVGISSEKYPMTDSGLPAPYSRTFHINYLDLPRVNKRLFKPDLLYAGGNYTVIPNRGIDNCNDAALKLLAASGTNVFNRDVGTSYSTPLVANLAVQILNQYPNLKSQTIKALLINSAEEVDMGNYGEHLHDNRIKAIIGHGVPKKERCLFSTDNAVTLVIEDSIKTGTIKSIPLHLPTYLNELNGKSILNITATLCFKFFPIADNQLCYCPVNIAFGIFKDTPLTEINTMEDENGNISSSNAGLNGGAVSQFKLSNNEGWSQDAYYKKVVLSNTQKIDFNITKDKLINTDNTISIAIQAHFHKALPEHIVQSLPKVYEFSLVIRISENLPERRLTNQLYNELTAINDVNLLGDMRAYLSGDNDLEAEL